MSPVSVSYAQQNKFVDSKIISKSCKPAGGHRLRCKITKRTWMQRIPESDTCEVLWDLIIPAPGIIQGCYIKRTCKGNTVEVEEPQEFSCASCEAFCQTIADADEGVECRFVGDIEDCPDDDYP